MRFAPACGKREGKTKSRREPMGRGDNRGAISFRESSRLVLQFCLLIRRKLMQVLKTP
jgi:hypothetical protein